MITPVLASVLVDPPPSPPPPVTATSLVDADFRVTDDEGAIAAVDIVDGANVEAGGKPITVAVPTLTGPEEDVYGGMA